jgi:hypothetical protein
MPSEPIPTIEPPLMAEFNEGTLHLTREGRRLLAAILENSPAFNTRLGRDLLLFTFSPAIRKSIPRSKAQHADIIAIINTLETVGRLPTGFFASQYALIVLVETIAEWYDFGTENEIPEATVSMSLARALRQHTGLPLVNMPHADNPFARSAPAYAKNRGQALSGLSAVDMPILVVYTDGQLQLTPSGHRQFLNMLSVSYWLFEERTKLLAHLPSDMLTNFERSRVQNFDLHAILYAAEAYGQLRTGPFAGQYALIVLAETAAQLRGFDVADPLRTSEARLFMELANIMREQVGLPPATQPLAN